MRPSIPASLLLISSTATCCGAFSTVSITKHQSTSTSVTSSRQQQPSLLVLGSVSNTNNNDENSSSSNEAAASAATAAAIIDRRTIFSTAAVVASSMVLTTLPSPASALVKGVAPPPKKSAGEKPKCTNVEECQAMADKRADEERAREESGPPPLVTKTGVKYRDLETGTTTVDPETGEDTSVTAKDGDDVSVYFKVLKLGKRSYDGLSGEGTVVFSRGYGLEDDEDKAGQKSFRTTIGSFQNIAALNEALVGMKLKGLRRFAILPQKGWEKATAACDGGPGGGGAGGEIRTDYVVVPTATMVQQEACFDNNKIPFPSTYAEQRRMAQRFDQSLIMEVQLVSIN
mmetsp:Transcript_27598/g.60777  ORF Transcript_27598/g.60777 Transcript_27598/m.60777 type:complete len:344 (-) Transcript_27598:65-1096(-)